MSEQREVTPPKQRERLPEPKWVEPTTPDPIARMWWGDLLEPGRRTRASEEWR